MKTIRLVAVCIWLLACVPANAEFMEIAASKIVTIDSNSSSGGRKILVQWDLPEELGKLIIDGAVISMSIPVDSSESAEVDVYPVQKAWDAQGMTTLDDWAKGAPIFDVETASHAIGDAKGDNTINADVYLTVRQQLLGQVSNFGFIIVPTVDSKSTVEPIEPNDSKALADAKLIVAYRKRR